MKIVVAIDSFKGSLTSKEANLAAATSINSIHPEAEIVQVPVSLIAGRISDRKALLKAGFTHVACINPKGITLEEAMRKEVATRNISQTLLSIIT